MFKRELEEYIEHNSSSETDLLYRLNRETHLKLVNPRMLSGHVQGKFIEMVSHMVKPKRILEIGTYTGYSGICLCAGMQEGGKLVTIDINEELTPMVMRYMEKAGLQDQVECISGDALEVLPTLAGDFDLIFIDADKENYQAYYDLTKPLLKKGGFMMIDNTLWAGKVFDTDNHQDETTNLIRAFNKNVTDDTETENVMLSVRDGITLVMKK